jgi:pSer/pThr/pTyr-binding forkhead associated (FHA) protein
VKGGAVRADDPFDERTVPRGSVATDPGVRLEEVPAPSLDIRMADGSRGRLLGRHREFLIGRALDNDLRVGDPAVSRHHVRLVPRRAGWEVVNDSANGMLVDGRPTERHPIDAPVEISLGQHPDAPRVLVVPCSSPALAYRDTTAR